MWKHLGNEETRYKFKLLIIKCKGFEKIFHLDLYIGEGVEQRGKLFLRGWGGGEIASRGGN